MFKMLVLQQWYDLSNFELEKQCIDRISFKKFLSFPEHIQDITTVWSLKKIVDNCKGEIWGAVAKPT
jgi:IS5 family transposase